ncbi:hypothetical protein DPMN_051622 [Dreissena polymorpha]|uniref:Uncharacterized protein n=1 Tax=Dreissena polymorpha TaxID=45954 RepID=A0A9D4HQG2_DREPO|nr:hypothetical protein DPMN_051622 [Dreissena polymorpha]
MTSPNALSPSAGYGRLPPSRKPPPDPHHHRERSRSLKRLWNIYIEHQAVLRKHQTQVPVRLLARAKTLNTPNRRLCCVNVSLKGAFGMGFRNLFAPPVNSPYGIPRNLATINEVLFIVTVSSTPEMFPTFV